MNRSQKCRFRQLTVRLFLVLLAVHLQAGTYKPSQDFLQANPEELEWFRDAKFGMFIHWGPVSLVGTELSWSRRGQRGGQHRPHSHKLRQLYQGEKAAGEQADLPWCTDDGHSGSEGKGFVPAEVYDNLYKEFNPTKFSARQWVSIAKAAGMKYLVLVTKHHDGFTMFDSQLTDYKITRSPFARDITAELAQACHEARIRLGFYYSQPDWHHPDYRTENHSRYIEYLHGQIRELCANYGKIDVLWFDGVGGSAEDWDSKNLFKMIRRLQPRILINPRAGLPGDFSTIEGNIGTFQTDRAWESCIPLTKQWAWKPADRMKSLKECITILVRCAGGDGNLLLNIGPMPTGEIEPRQVDRLKEIGGWLADYGKTVYETRGGPFKPQNWGASTYSGSAIYLHILEWGNDTITLPPIDRKVVKSWVVTGGTVTVKQSEAGIEVHVPADNRRQIDTIVALLLDGPAGEIPPL